MFHFIEPILPMYIGSLTIASVRRHGGVETDFGARSRRRNRPLLARLLSDRVEIARVTS